MPHPHTAYVPKLDEFVLLRQALGIEFTVAQVTALNHRDCKAEVVYLAPGERGTTREIRKWVGFKMLMAYDVPEVADHAEG